MALENHYTALIPGFPFQECSHPLKVHAERGENFWVEGGIRGGGVVQLQNGGGADS